MFLIKVAIIALAGFLLTMFLPWYLVLVVAFIVGLSLSNKPGNNFLAGFFGVGLLWLGLILFIDLRNEHLMSSKIALLFSGSLGREITYTWLIVITTLLGALLGGLASMSGAMIMDDGSRKRLRKAVKNGRYTLKMK